VKRTTHSRGFSLIECLVYIVVIGVLMGVVGQTFVQGLHASAAAQQAVRAVEQAETALEWLRADLREAAEVVVPMGADEGEVAAWPPDAPLLVRFQDGTSALYVLEDGVLTRYVVPEGADPGDVLVPGKDWRKRRLDEQFEELRVAPVAGAPRLYRVDLALRISSPLLHQRGHRPSLGHFTTAIRLRSEETP
jgi:prepilin-type N-terminal cleavage/methylation domain-containing protein